MNTIINNNILLNNKNDSQLSTIYLDLIKTLWNKKIPKSFSHNDFMKDALLSQYGKLL